MTEPCDIPLVLAVIGLTAATGGAFLLYFFGAPPLNVTEGGAKLVEWGATASDMERQVNARRFRTYRRWARLGVLLLSLGSLLQLVSLILQKVF
jgi:hypothetical protein